MFNMILLCLLFIIEEHQINGQAIVSDPFQSQTSTTNDRNLLMKVRKLENDYITLRQQYTEIEDKHRRLEDEIREIKIQSLENLRNNTNGK